MKKNAIRLLLLAILTLGFASTVGAQDCTVGCDAYYQDPGMDSSSTVSGNYYSCMAKGSWGGTCVACGMNVQQCVTVRASASCQCDSSNCSVSGYCTYQP